MIQAFSSKLLADDSFSHDLTTGGGSSSGKVAGAVIGVLLFLVATFTTVVLLVILTYKLRKKHQVKRMQMDILV